MGRCPAWPSSFDVIGRDPAQPIIVFDERSRPGPAHYNAQIGPAMPGPDYWLMTTPGFTHEKSQTNHTSSVHTQPYHHDFVCA